MKAAYLRYATYVLLLGAVYVATHPNTAVLPISLSPPPYAVQAERLLSSDRIAALSGPSLFQVSGGLPSGSGWQYREGPDFDVWGSTIGEGSARVSVGIYAGFNPNVRPPAERLAPGIVGGFPVLWWQHEDADYRTRWDAVIPCGREASSGYLHVWLLSFYPDKVRDAAETLKELTIARRATSLPNQVPEPTSGSVTPRAASSAEPTEARDARVAPPPAVAHR
ncbi:hypothetical protein Oter_3047 [Opitutus terrae PB90-1]|uniref:Uncharacterized protein n=1 Tax=Opitutus terrae (strain DSM 11246 / JCM 15787 / PB90-1) TaxID=452637 RepID=B1ZZ04_OPITP|nr:hypothetical protein Oter_3047 [Opitutus terrae PB90-1]